MKVNPFRRPRKSALPYAKRKERFLARIKRDKSLGKNLEYVEDVEQKIAEEREIQAQLLSYADDETWEKDRKRRKRNESM